MWTHRYMIFHGDDDGPWAHPSPGQLVAMSEVEGEGYELVSTSVLYDGRLLLAYKKPAVQGDVEYAHWGEYL